MQNFHHDTIVAIATPAGKGGVGIVRLSGPKSLSIALQMSKQKQVKPRYALLTKCFDEASQVIDEGIIIYFKAPHSYTGEDVVEFQMHGSPYVLAEIMRICALHGARLARPGEFTERAFLNDKMDLVQAEAVVDLINAQSSLAAKMAVRTLQGTFSTYVHQIEADIKAIRMYVESTIDFSDEAIEWLEQYHWQERIERIIQEIEKLKQQAHQGQILQEGLKIVLAGRPNAGKSTLMNALVEKDVAIVTSIAGTTRDVMKEHVLLDDIPVTLIDTAGLRVSDDEIEQEGIRRAWDVIRQADIVLFLHDASAKNWQEDELPKDLTQGLPEATPILHVMNKVDIFDKVPLNDDYLNISAKNGLGIDNLKSRIKSYFGIQLEQSEFIARKRHLVIFSAVQKLLQTAIAEFQIHLAPELLAEDLRFAHEGLTEITGQFSADDLLGEIFSHFCIGK
ncbi:MAG TPA: tRNA uridine-5-carboxymethylaminomethyl(34) synthesis GTPase MnmE [Legionellales bacterium]|nr:tRNA uridine-5-carboxymethylaminomethyl(34) synthesis GTPase MnmE [Legionellales bacterium]